METHSLEQYAPGRIVLFRMGWKGEVFADVITNTVCYWVDKKWKPVELYTCLYEKGHINPSQVVELIDHESIPQRVLPKELPAPKFGIGDEITFDCGEGTEKGTVSTVEWIITEKKARDEIRYGIKEQPKMESIEEGDILL